MTVTLVPVTEADSVAPESPDAGFVRARLEYGLPPEQITRELVRRGRNQRDAQRSVEAVRREHYRRI